MTMTVNLTVAATLGGLEPADTLAGGGTGLDLGTAINGQYTPLIDKTDNTGFAQLFISHDGINQISDLGSFLSSYSQPFGGVADTANDELAALFAEGAASDNSPNNNGSPALGQGLRVEYGADLDVTLGLALFDNTRNQVAIYGKVKPTGINNTKSGTSLDDAFTFHQDAMIVENGGDPQVPSAPVAGVVGPAGNSVLGDTATMKLRYYLAETATDGGIGQVDLVIKYSFTE
jgi:hypothetical protein